MFQLNFTLICNYQYDYDYGVFCSRSLICQLENVDPGKLKHEEKLAFWINIHNALVMHVIILISRCVNFIILNPFMALFLWI